jgi:hypothetical protein
MRDFEAAECGFYFSRKNERGSAASLEPIDVPRHGMVESRCSRTPVCAAPRLILGIILE